MLLNVQIHYRKVIQGTLRNSVVILSIHIVSFFTRIQIQPNIVTTGVIAEGSISTTPNNQESAVDVIASTNSEGSGKIVTSNETANSTDQIPSTDCSDSETRQKESTSKEHYIIENQTPMIQNVDNNEGGTSRSKRGRNSPEDYLKAKTMKPKPPKNLKKNQNSSWRVTKKSE